MITGDYHHTAVAVARDVGMVAPDGQVVVIDVPRKEAVRLAVSSPPSSDGSQNAANSPPLSPSSSLRQRQADFAHNFFGLSLGSKQASAARDEADKTVRPSFEAERAIRNASLESEGRRVSFGLPPSRVSLVGASGRKSPDSAAAAAQKTLAPGIALAKPQPSDHDHPNLLQLPRQTSPSSVALPDKPVAGLSSDVAKVPLQPSLYRLNSGSPALPGLSKRTSGLQPPGALSRRISGMPLQTTLSRFSSGMLSTESPPSTLQRASSGLSSGPVSPSPQRPLTRAASLTRLPSQIPISILASLPAVASDDMSVSSAQSSKPLLRLGNQLMQASTRLLQPFRQPDAKHSLIPTESLLKGLTFTSGAGRQHVQPGEAVKSMAEGTVQCAVTADAFEYLLQMRDVSVLEAVLRSAVVFSRMQPHQKGQVVDLLGAKGIHQPFEGQPRHVKVGVNQS